MKTVVEIVFFKGYFLSINGLTADQYAGENAEVKFFHITVEV
jgi:hypothetical protein